MDSSGGIYDGLPIPVADIFAYLMAISCTRCMPRHILWLPNPLLWFGLVVPFAPALHDTANFHLSRVSMVAKPALLHLLPKLTQG